MAMILSTSTTTSSGRSVCFSVRVHCMGASGSQQSAGMSYHHRDMLQTCEDQSIDKTTGASAKDIKVKIVKVNNKNQAQEQRICELVLLSGLRLVLSQSLCIAYGHGGDVLRRCHSYCTTTVHKTSLCCSL